jgi:hypothetical protein
LEPVNLERIALWIKVGWAAVFVSLLLVLLSTCKTADLDLWGYLAFGRLFWQSQHFPYHDVFSYPPTLHPWVYHEWLTGVLFYPLYHSLGDAGLRILKYWLGLGTIGLVYLTARVRGGNALASALFAIIVFVMVRIWYDPLRAHTFTFFFFALSLYLLERARLLGRWQGLFLLPLLQIPWCNLHGGFPAGIGLIAIYATGELIARRPWKPYLVVFLLSGLATLINPYGLDYWVYIFSAVIKPRPHIIEWASLLKAYHDGTVNIMFILTMPLLSIMVALGVWQARWREVTASLALAVTLILGLRHIRHLAFMWLLVGAYFPLCLQFNVNYLQSRPSFLRLWHRTGIKMAILTVLSIWTIVNLAFFSSNHSLSIEIPKEPKGQGLSYYPVKAVNFIKEHNFKGNILTTFGWGEFLIWELSPQCSVGFDGRYETVYPTEVEEDYMEFHYARSHWRRFLEKYPTDLILLQKETEIAKLIQKEPQWRQVYADANCVLFMAASRCEDEKARGRFAGRTSITEHLANRELPSP